MKYKKGDLVKVIEADAIDVKSYGVKEGEIYEVIDETDNGVSINAGRVNRFVYNHQIEKVKKKSKKDLRIQELENQIQQMKYRYC